AFTCAGPSDIRSRDRSHATVDTAPSRRAAPRRCTDPITRDRAASNRHTNGCSARNRSRCSTSERPSRSTEDRPRTRAWSSRTPLALSELMFESYHQHSTMYIRDEAKSRTIHYGPDTGGLSAARRYFVEGLVLVSVDVGRCAQ